jgi:hypothetical protein
MYPSRSRIGAHPSSGTVAPPVTPLIVYDGMIHPRFSWLYITNACPICRRFDMHCVAAARFRAPFSVGSRIAMRIAMIPITTSNSTSVNAPAARFIVAYVLDMCEMVTIVPRRQPPAPTNVKIFAWGTIELA